jgi:hypothetical protein
VRKKPGFQGELTNLTLVLENPTSLLGQLQRGRGQGYIQALEADRAEVHVALIHCVTHDPRWDSQLEERAWYYAELMLRTNLDDLTPIATYLRTITKKAARRGELLAVITLGVLAEQGHRGAIDLLRQQVADGPLWALSLICLADVPDPVAMAGLDEVVCRRFPGSSLLAEHDEYLWWHAPPWTGWRQTNPRIARIGYEAEQRREPRPPKPRVDRRMATSKLLSLTEGRTRRRIGDILGQRIGPKDVALLVEATRSDSHHAAWAAFWALGVQENPIALPVALDTIKRLPVAYRVGAYRYIEALPPEHTLVPGRKWFLARSWRVRLVGQDVLNHHAQLEDVPMLRTALRTAHEAQDIFRTAREAHDMYRECDILRALARLPQGGPYHEAATSFMETPSSRCRRLAAAVLAAADPAFAATWAVECLWDCESETRAIGCNHVDVAIPGVLARLRELAKDRWEESEVRKAAAARIPKRQPLRSQR